MDLFEAIALSFDDKPAEIRPAILSPYEVGQQPQDIAEVVSEISAEPDQKVEKQTSEPTHSIEVKKVPETASELNPKEQIQIEKEPVELPTHREISEPTSRLDKPRLTMKIKSDEVQLETQPSSKIEVPTSKQPIENTILPSPSTLQDESPTKTVRYKKEDGATEIVQTNQVISNTFLSENHTTYIENLTDITNSQTNQFFESRIENVSPLVHSEPKIEVVYPPIEVAVSALNQFQTVNSEIDQPPRRNDVAKESGQENSKKIVEINIGRIEINAPKSATPTRRITPTRTSPNRLSLDEILKKRGLQ
jgi:hypothetical protein